jgi:hypothetical protein
MDGKFLKIDELLGDPDFYLFTICMEQLYGADGEQFVLKFRRMTREKFRTEAHLDNNFRSLEDVSYSYTIPFDQVLNRLEELNPQSSGPHYIFHHGYCGSTLLARAVEEVGGYFVLREPLALTLWSRPKRFIDQNAETWHRGLRMVTHLLSRKYESSETVIIKPNDDNNVMSDLLSLNSVSKGLYLYSNVEDFIVAILAGEEARTEAESRVAFIRRRVERFSGDSAILSEFIETQDLDELTVPKAAALVWLLQLYTAAEHAQRMGNSRIRALNSHDFLTRPTQALRKVTEFFGRPVSEEVAKRVMEGSVMSKHAKRGGSYDQATHNKRREADHKLFSREISEGLNWAEKIMNDYPLPSSAVDDFFENAIWKGHLRRPPL